MLVVLRGPLGGGQESGRKAVSIRQSQAVESREKQKEGKKTLERRTTSNVCSGYRVCRVKDLRKWRAGYCCWGFCKSRPA